MTIDSSMDEVGRDEVGLESFNKAITKGFPAEQEDSIKGASNYLVARIRDGTVAAEASE